MRNLALACRNVISRRPTVPDKLRVRNGCCFWVTSATSLYRLGGAR